MNTTVAVIINVIIMAAIIYGLMYLKKLNLSFTVRVFIAMGMGIAFGAALQLIYGGASDIVKESNTWFSVVGNGYVRLLRMIVIPLIFVSITNAIIMQDSKNLGKMATQIIALLLITTAIAALIGVGSATVFKLDASNLKLGESEMLRGESLETSLEDFQSRPIPQQITDIIPTNPFYAMTGQGDNATLSVVLFAAFVALATLGIRASKPESAKIFADFIQTLHDIVMRMVTMVLRLTPFGVLALMTRMVSTSDFVEILRLVNFVIASYVALILVFIVHLIILAINGINPVTYIKKASTALLFGFSSRSSAGTLPINVETQIDRFGVSPGHANLSASLGTSIGQNG
jgi:L-cystine uptake protein TcyP (sodium:dicarboxylate symporter family)